MKIDSSLIGSLITSNEKEQYLLEGIMRFIEELNNLKSESRGGWVTIARAAKEVSLSTSALRQRIKSSKSLLPEKIVWKQAAPGCSIFVNLDTLGEYL